MTLETRDIRFRLRGDEAADWVTKNPILLKNEPGIETDTNRLKFGDGVTRWLSLPYFAGGGAGGATFVHTQVAPSATWIIDHNLGRIKEPVILLDSDPLVPVLTDVEFGSVNQITIIFPLPVSGKAYL